MTKQPLGPMYFNWKAYPFEKPPEMRGEASRYQVVVVGAGPVGLSLALGLAQSGVRVLVLEQNDQVSDGSRAISLDATSMGFLDQLGLGAAFAKAAIQREANLVYYGDQLVLRQDYVQAPDAKYPPYSVLQQCWMEQILLEALQSEPEVEIRWHSKVIGLSQAVNGVAVSVATPAGEYALEADYLVACDGGRGNCRHLLGLRYEPLSAEDYSLRSFVVCDFQMKSALSRARRLYLHPSYRPDSMALMHAQPFDTWRLDYPLADDECPQEALSPQRIEARLGAHLNWMGENSPYEVIWSSLYRPRAASLRSYRHGRMLFAGDAAHLSPIFGGRGLNLGFGDSRNLIWRLATVVQGQASDGLLNDYDRERQSIVRKAVRDLSEASLFMARPTRGARLMSQAVQELAAYRPFAAALLDAQRAPQRLGYSVTADLLADPPAGAMVGNPLPNPLLSNGRWLHDLLGAGMTLITWAPKTDVVGADCGPDLPEGVKWLVLGPGDDPSGQLAQLLGAEPGLMLLIRPDRYIAARTAVAVDLCSLPFPAAVTQLIAEQRASRNDGGRP